MSIDLTQQYIEYRKQRLLSHWTATARGGYDYRKLREMTRDPVVVMGLSIIKLPIMSAEFSVECESPEIAEACEAELRRTWREFCQKALRALDFGFCALEKVFDQQEGRWSIRKWNDSEPEYTIILRTEDGSFAGFRRKTPWSDVIIPAEKAWVWAWGGEYGNLYGTPYIAPAYRYYIHKELVILDALRFYEKWGGISAIIRYPYEPDKLMRDSSGNIIRNLNEEKAIEIYDQLRNNAGLIMPALYDEQGNKLWEIEPLEWRSSAKSAAFLEFLQYLDKRILLGILIPDQIVLEGKYGSYALFDGRQNLLATNIEGIMEAFALPIDKYWLNRPEYGFIDLNFGSDAPRARIKFAPLKDEDRAFLQDIYKIVL